LSERPHAPPPAPLLFAVREYGEFPEMLRVADALHSLLSRPVVFWFVKACYRRLQEDTRAVIARGFTWLDENGQWSDQVASGCVPNFSTCAVTSLGGSVTLVSRNAVRWVRLRTLIFLPRFILNGVLRDMGIALRDIARDMANFTRDVTRFRARYRIADGLLVSIQPSLVVVGQDVPGTELPFLLIAAGQRRVPRLIVPFAMFSLKETADYAYARCEHRVKSSAVNAFVAKFYPHWVLDWLGERLLRLPGWRALALEYVGLVRGLPWTPLSEPAEALTAESEVAAQALAEIGVVRDRIFVVGSPVHDQLAAHLKDRLALKKRLCRTHGLDPSRLLIVCGWPANMFPWLGRRVIAYGSYEEVAAVWAAALADVRDRHGVNVIVSVHPKTLPHEYLAALDRGLPCSFEGTDELIAASDLFTTLNGSSITSWAIACAVPVLLFDCFDTRYNDFSRVPGCVHVQDEKGFARMLSLLCADEGARAELARAQREVAERWGVLDGCASARLVGLVRRLIGEAST
jgi:hypothetical protein